jgi:hypothetical protein
MNVDSADESRDAGARKVTEPELSACMNFNMAILKVS